jgi:hypothetical protein
MLVINKLTYDSTIWSNTSAKNIKKLQTVQNFAARGWLQKLESLIISHPVYKNSTGFP